MPSVELTPKLITTEASNQEPRAADMFYRDTVIRGLYLKVSKTGHTSFGMEYRDSAGKQRRATINEALPSSNTKLSSCRPLVQPKARR